MSPPDWSAEPLHRRSRRHRQGSYALPTRLKKEAGGRETAERTMTRETSRTAAPDGREAGHDTSIAVPPSGNPDGCLCPVRPPVLHGPALLMPGAMKARTIARLFVLATRTWLQRTGTASQSRYSSLTQTTEE